MSEAVTSDDGQDRHAGVEGEAEADPLQAALEAELNEERDTLQPGEERVLPYEQTGVLVIGGRRLVVTSNSETVTLVGRDAEGNQHSVDMQRRERLDLGVTYDSAADEVLGVNARPIVSIRRSDEGVVVQCNAPGAMLLAIGEVAPVEEQAIAEIAEQDSDPYDTATPGAHVAVTPETALDTNDIFSSPQRLLDTLHDESVDSETRQAIMHCLGAWGQLENARMAQELWQTLEQDNPGDAIENSRAVLDRVAQAYDGLREYTLRLGAITRAFDERWSEADRIGAFTSAVDAASHVGNMLTYDDTVTRFREAMTAWADKQSTQISAVDRGVDVQDQQVVEGLVRHRQPGETVQELAGRLGREAEAVGANYQRQRDLLGFARQLSEAEPRSEESIIQSLQLTIQEELQSLRYAPDADAAAGTIARLQSDMNQRIGTQFALLYDLAEKIQGQRQLQQTQR